jgi:hypothetical protein
MPNYGEPGFIIPEAMAWENFSLQINGVDILRFISFNLDYNASYAFNIGKGGHRASYAIKEYTEEAKATLLVEELKGLIQMATALGYGGDLRKIPTLVAIAKMQTDAGVLQLTVPSIRIMKFSIGSKQGDDKTEVPLDFAVTSYPIISFV